MSALKLYQEPRRGKTRAMIPKDRNLTIEDDLIDLFPLPRYFQVHFEHIHQNNRVVNGELEQLRQAIAKVDEKMERLLALLKT